MSVGNRLMVPIVLSVLGDLYPHPPEVRGLAEPTPANEWVVFVGYRPTEGDHHGYSYIFSSNRRHTHTHIHRRGRVRLRTGEGSEGDPCPP